MENQIKALFEKEFGNSLLVESYMGRTDNGRLQEVTRDWLISKYESAIKWGQENK